MRVHVTSRNRCHTGHDVQTHSWFDTENAAPVQVYKHIHTRANAYLDTSACTDNEHTLKGLSKQIKIPPQ